MNQSLCCPDCGEVIIKSYNEGYKLRSKVTLIKSTGAFAICRGCDAEVQVPFCVDENIAKSLSTEKKLKLYVPRGK